MIQQAQFSTFLEIIFTFAHHPSLIICHSATLIWNILLKHDQISKDPIFLEYIPKIIEVIGPKVLKVNSFEMFEVINFLFVLNFLTASSFCMFFFVDRCSIQLLELCKFLSHLNHLLALIMTAKKSLPRFFIDVEPTYSKYSVNQH